MSAVKCPCTFGRFGAPRAPLRKRAVADVAGATQHRNVAARSAAGGPQRPSGPFEALSTSVNNVLQKYDILSALMGSLVVTTFCVAQGQSMLTALGLTMMATIMALVAEEAFFED